MKVKNLLIRGISGLIYMALIITACLYGHIGIMILAIILAFLASTEFTKMYLEGGRADFFTETLDVFICVTLALSSMPGMIFIFLGLLVVRFISELYSYNANPLKALAYSMLNIVYIGIPLFAMTMVPLLLWQYQVRNPLAYSSINQHLSTYYNWGMLLVVFFMIWINDTGAFLIGSLFGKHKLFERVSPKKTWEGFLGGFIFTVGSAALFCRYGYGLYVNIDNYPFWLGLGALVSIVATFGDLVESLIKRCLWLKDSGNLIPGHGGILDRIDSLLLVMPAVALYYMVWSDHLFIFWPTPYN